MRSTRFESFHSISGLSGFPTLIAPSSIATPLLLPSNITSGELAFLGAILWKLAVRLLSCIVLRSETLLQNIPPRGAPAPDQHRHRNCPASQNIKPPTSTAPSLLLSSDITSSTRIQRIFCPSAPTLYPSQIDRTYPTLPQNGRT